MITAANLRLSLKHLGLVSTSGFPSWLHIRITCQAFQKYHYLRPSPRDYDFIGLGWSSGINHYFCKALRAIVVFSQREHTGMEKALLYR